MRNGGRSAIKRIDCDGAVVEADIFADGHDDFSAVLLYRFGSAAVAGSPHASVGE